jgi:type IV pilus assembly protein PilC
LQTVADQTENKRLKSIAGEVVASIEGGSTLADSFAKHPEVFDQVFISLISAGEASGTLDKALARIADQQEKDAAVMSKIRGALTYPIIVLVVIGAVLAFMLFTVVPQVKKLYKDLHQTLPFISQVMVDAADFAIRFWWLLIIVFIGLVVLGQRYLRTPAGQKFLDGFKLHVPMFGTMFQKLYMARFARTGQTLMASGVSMLDMLRISATAVNNSYVGGAINRSAEKVKGGKSLADSLRDEPLVLPLVSQMIKVGEQSGRIDEMMGKTASVYENELDETIKSISTAIEPILMVVLAVVAGMMVAAILLPIYGLVNNIHV